MSDSSHVIVPVRVSALMVNDTVRGTPFRRWVPDFTHLDRLPHHSPEPEKPTHEVHKDAAFNGVHLHWELPSALREGVVSSTGAPLTPRRVPNRWLVVRYSGDHTGTPSATGWLVQSDCLRPATAPVPPDSSPYAVPHPTDPDTSVPHRIGRVLKLSGTLTAPDTSTPLTAAGPGMAAFSVFQPCSTGVFSLHDALTELDLTSTHDLSYLVLGWYTKAAGDPLAEAADSTALAALLRRLGWCTDTQAKAPARSLYAGSVLGVTWQKSNRPAADEKPTGSDVTFGAAESSAEGLTALALQHAPDTWKKDDLLERLQALQYGLLHQYGRDGRAAIQRRAHESRFDPVPGGFTWDFMSPSSPHDKPAPPLRPLPERERTWLAELNADQAEYDRRRRALARNQERLYELWWYRMQVDALRAETPDNSRNKKLRQGLGWLSERISPELRGWSHGRLAARVAAEQEELEEFRPICRASDERTLKEEIHKEVGAWQPSPAGVLTRLAKPPFHRAMEPVVLIRGAGAERLSSDPGAIRCRHAGQEVVAADDKQDEPVCPEGFSKAGTPKSELADLPAATALALLREFRILDCHRSATQVCFADTPKLAVDRSSKTDGRAVALRRQTAEWRQPWTPLYLEWQALYYAVPYADQRTGHNRANWEFTGDTYVWRGQGHVAANKQPTPRYLSGRILLSPHAVHNLAQRYDRMKDEAPRQPEDFQSALAELLGAEQSRDLISQALDGFTEQLSGREAHLHRRPASAVAALLDGNHAYAPCGMKYVAKDLKPLPGEKAPLEELEAWMVPPAYEPLRAGQFHFAHLAIVDRFGRSHDLVSSKQHDHKTRSRPTRGASVIPDDKTADSNKADAVVFDSDVDFWKKDLVHLRPRLLQPARLDFTALGRDDDTTALRSGDGDDICAWIAPNLLDDELFCYDHTGTLLGRIAERGDKVVWLPVTGAAPAPHKYLAGLRAALIDKGPAALHDTIVAIDRARLAISPDRPTADHPALRMLGRPLALVRAHLGLHRDAGPVVPVVPSKLAARWPITPYKDYAWPVALGSPRMFTDGLVGYFHRSGKDSSDYDHLTAVSKPTKGLRGDYVRDRANGAALALQLGGGGHTLTLLMDPWAPVHATTHILPTALLALDPDAVAYALARMEARFACGPVLGALRAVAERSPLKGPSETEEQGGTPGEVTAAVRAFPVPLPVVEHGDWDWVPENGAPSRVIEADAVARVTPETPVRCRTGYLRLRRGPRRPH